MDLSFLNQVGTVKSVFATNKASAMHMYLFQWVQDVTNELRKSAEQKANATGGLAQSAAPEVVDDGGKVTATISMDDYYDFVNKGVNGIQATVGSPYSFRTPYANTNMVTSIMGVGGMGWIGAKGIVADDGDYKSLAWGIATNRKKFGIEPTKFFDDVITEDLLNEFKANFERDFARPIEIIITKPVENNKK
jgi:hypothetical protein